MRVFRASFANPLRLWPQQIRVPKHLAARQHLIVLQRKLAAESKLCTLLFYGGIPYP